MLKKAVFFSIDAFIALIIVFILLLTLYPLLRTSTATSSVPADTLAAFSSVLIGEINDSYAKGLLSAHAINNTNLSVLEALGELYATNLPVAEEFAESLLSSIEVKENIGIWYGSRLLASVNTTDFESAERVESARQVITGIREGEKVTGFSARAFLSSSLDVQYFIFGGYVGDGNISAQIDYEGNISSAEMEIAINEDFDLYVNGNFIGRYNKSSSVFIPQRYILPAGFFHSGSNTIELRGKNLAISGGFVKILYERSNLLSQKVRKYLPGVDGIVNLYDSLSFGSSISNMSIVLHYNSSYPIFLNLGNVSLFNSTMSGEQTAILSDTFLASALSYSKMINSTAPLRLGTEEIFLNGSGGNADVILITDVSGSMDWRLDSDASGTSRGCDDPFLNTSSTKRISLAKCLDIQFVSSILGGNGNRVGLVSFSSSANSFINLTADKTILNNTISSYNPGGGTCVSCAINRAYALLQAQSDNSRQKFIVVMTDGVTNARSTATCSDILADGGFLEKVFAGGAGGAILQKNSTIWSEIASPLTTQINDIDFFNSSLAFGVGSSGKIIKWDGALWSSVFSPIVDELHGVDIYNATFALAVGTNGRIVQWNGAGWSALNSIANSPLISGIHIYNSSLAFAVGVRSSRARIYKSTNGGAGWSEQYTGSSGSTLEGIKILSATLGFAVGNNGRIVQWNGAGWSIAASPTIHNLYAIDSLSGKTFAVGGNSGTSRIIQYSGSSWNSVFGDSSADSLRDVAVISANEVYAVGKGASVVEFDGTSWKRNFAVVKAYSGNSSSGIFCTADEDSCSEQSSFPALNANYSSCRAQKNLGSKVYAIGFGPVSTCNFASQTLQGIANCGNGTYSASTDAGALQQFYASIAQDILQLSYSEQTAQASGNLTNRIYPDSYIEFSTSSMKRGFGLFIPLEKKFIDDSMGSFAPSSDSQLVEARVISYSGARWTALVLANNIIIYNLSSYGGNFGEFGDPYAIQLPLSIVAGGANIELKTGTGAGNLTAGSSSNKILYSIVKNLSSYSPLSSRAEGCFWSIEFEDGAILTMNIPSSYAGSMSCSYTSGAESYDTLDVLQSSAYDLLRLLDFDYDGRVDSKFAEQNLQIEESKVEGIPYTWSTEVQIRVWR